MQELDIRTLLFTMLKHIKWIILAVIIGAVLMSAYTVVMVDDITNLILNNLGLPTAQNFYEALGWKFKT